MNLGAARSLIRNMVLERAGDTGLVTDAELNEIINSAARLVFNRIAVKYPDIFAKRSAANVAVPTNCVVPFSSLTSQPIFKILNAYAGTTGAAESAMQMINNFDKTQDRHVYEPYSPAPAIPFRYYIEGETVCFSPITSGTFDARFSYVEQPAGLVNDSDNLWGGQLVSWHDWIALFAATMVSAKDTGALVALYSQLDNMVNENFGQQHPLSLRWLANPYNPAPKEPRP
jgi:hypothetical protein